MADGDYLLQPDPAPELPREGTHVLGKTVAFRNLKPGDLLLVDNGVEQVTSDMHEGKSMFQVRLSHNNTLSSVDPDRMMLVFVPTLGGGFPWA